MVRQSYTTVGISPTWDSQDHLPDTLTTSVIPGTVDTVCGLHSASSGTSSSKITTRRSKLVESLTRGDISKELDCLTNCAQKFYTIRNAKSKPAESFTKSLELAFEGNTIRPLPRVTCRVGLLSKQNLVCANTAVNSKQWLATIGRSHTRLIAGAGKVWPWRLTCNHRRASAFLALGPLVST